MLALFMLAALGSAIQTDPVSYVLTLSDAAASTIQVEMRLPPVAPGAALIVPRGIPMGYGTAPYDRFFGDVRAFGAAGAELKVVPSTLGPRFALGSGKQVPARVTWNVNVDAMEAAILGASDTSKKREGYLDLLGYSVFAFVEGLDARPVRLEIRGPKGWPVFTTLAPKAPPETDAVQVEADGFYALADSQILMGPRLVVHRSAAESRPAPLADAPALKAARYDGSTPPLFVAGYADCAVEVARIADLGEIALEALVDWFGSAPFRHYTMVVEFVKPRSSAHHYGFSMEHLDSGTFFFTTEDAITQSIDARRASGALYNYAHHIAHSWLPKRCAMAGYYPFPWEYAPVLDSIWFSEGFGQFIAADALEPVLPGTRDRIVEQRFKRLVALTPLSLRRMPLVDVSRLASTQYSETFGTGVNVFARGGLMAGEIDAEVRRKTGGTKSLREGIRALVARCAPGDKPCDVPALKQCLRDATGVDVAPIVDRWLAPME